MLILPKLIYNFIYWWIYEIPRNTFNVLKKITYFVNNEFSFTLNIKLIFTPLYGDNTIIGRVIGFILRIIFIVVGFFFVGFLALASVILPTSWYLLPLIMFYYLGFWSLPIVAAMFLYHIYITIDQPDKRVENVDEENKLFSFRPQVKEIIRKIKKNPSQAIASFMKSPEINSLLEKAELTDINFPAKIGQVEKLSTKKVEVSSFVYGKKNRSRYVEKEHLLLGLLSSIPGIDNILSEFGIELKTIEETALWIVGKREDESKLYFWQEDYETSTISGFGHGLIGRVTPHLDAISVDYTKMAKKGRLKNIIGREDEIKKIAQLLGGSRENVLLIGEPGCGKTSIVMGMAHRIMHGTKYKTLQNKRIVNLQTGSLIAGSKTTGEIAEKLKDALDDAIGSGDIILFIDEIHALVGSVNEGEGYSTIFSILEPHLSSNQLQFIGATSIENYRKYIESIGSFSRLFEIVEIPESNQEDTLEILKYIADLQEVTFGVRITMPALLTILKLSGKLIHNRVLPDKAIDVLIRSVALVNDSTRVVTSKVVEQEISEMTHIPVTAVTEEESEKLLNIYREMKKYVVGQDHALEKISSALKRARVGIRDEKKPIASFLFVGTTGVGKTETAKTLGKVYFGDETNMIRLDMSEYQHVDSIEKLIGSSDGKTRGLLTEAVRSKPFAVILLDEIEKAHHKILLTFLQVLDDARLTDSTGRTVDFTNTIIIATSNVGTKQIQSITEKSGSYEEIEIVALKAVRENFAPEFLNRFTDIIVYKPLDLEHVRKIARILLYDVKGRTQEQNVKISFSEELIDELVKRGYNPQWGARPMARVIEDSVETHIAEKLLTKEIKRGDVVKLGIEVFDERPH